MKTLKRLIFLLLTVTLISANIFAGNVQPGGKSCPLKITDAHLASFDSFNSLLEYLSNHNVVELDFSDTIITDDQLANILNQIGRNLKMLDLRWCRNLNNYEAIKNCTNLQNSVFPEQKSIIYS